MSSSRSDAKAGSTKPRPATETINTFLYTIFLLKLSCFFRAVSALVTLCLPPGAEVLQFLIARLSGASQGGFLALRSVYCKLQWVRRLEGAPSLSYLAHCAVSYKEKLVSLERCLVFHDAVFGDTNAIQPRAERAQ